MSDVRELHNQAMALAEKASVAKLNGELQRANDLLLQAYKNELEAANLLRDISSPEPTRSILYRSAASLAIDCNELREAERLISIGLSGNPPSDIAEELRDLFERVNFHRHLDLKGIILESNELQMSIAGRGISAGIAPSEHFIIRIEDARKLMVRTVERLLGRPYREGGVLGKPVREYGLFISVPRTSSFAVSLRVSHPKPPLPGLEEEIQFVHSEKIIDEIMTCLDSFNNAKEEELRERIPQEAYYRNFIGLVKNLAPDGDNVRQVGFTAVRRGEEQRVSLTRTRDQLELVRKGKEELVKAEGELRTIKGTLLYADATRSVRQNIRLIDDAGHSHNIIVPEGMMSDIVKPLWEEHVQVTGYYKGKSLRLEDISRVSE